QHPCEDEAAYCISSRDHKGNEKASLALHLSWSRTEITEHRHRRLRRPRRERPRGRAAGERTELASSHLRPPPAVGPWLGRMTITHWSCARRPTWHMKSRRTSAPRLRLERSSPQNETNRRMILSESWPCHRPSHRVPAFTSR